MTTEKINLGLVCGGISGEHEVSLVSAKNIQQALNRENYQVSIIAIDKQGHWHLSEDTEDWYSQGSVKEIQLNLDKPIVSAQSGGILVDQQQHELTRIDVFFPITHGDFGEDGTLQSQFRMWAVPYVGPDLWGSAIAMDKDVSKRLLKESGIAVTPSLTLRAPQRLSFENAETLFGLPIFVKPCRQGSSLGVSKVETKEEYENALTQAYRFGHKVLLEQTIDGQEIECAVLGNENPIVAEVLGEIVPTQDFYSYEAKYVNEEGAILKIPAEIPQEMVRKLREASFKAFRLLECEGLARIDFLVSGDQYYLNEVNTLPGFTNISMYPKLWEASGVAYSELLDQLIALAQARFQRDHSG